MLILSGGSGNATITVDTSNAINTASSTAGFALPIGTTAQRPSNPAAGTMRYNTTIADVEIYANGSWSAINITPPPVISVAPVASGNAVVGQTVSCTTGTWTNTPTSYGYQWLSANVAIGGATSNTFSNMEVYIPNYAGSNNKSASSDGVGETNATTIYASLQANLWNDIPAITSIRFNAITGGGSFMQYSTFYLYGVAKLGTTPVIVPYATGGDTIMTDGTYWYHAFVASGTFTPQKGLSCDVLVLAGGGGGGGASTNSAGAAGGGAGGYVYSTAQSFVSLTNYTATIGWNQLQSHG